MYTVYTILQRYMYNWYVALVLYWYAYSHSTNTYTCIYMYNYVHIYMFTCQRLGGLGTSRGLSEAALSINLWSPLYILDHHLYLIWIYIYAPSFIYITGWSPLWLVAPHIVQLRTAGRWPGHFGSKKEWSPGLIFVPLRSCDWAWDFDHS